MSEDGGPRHVAETFVDGLAPAEPDQAAAVAAAIGAHLRDHELAAAAAAAEGDDADGWPGRKWQFAGRLARDRRAGLRVADATPSDPWTAAGRADRL
jgi:hypothetical protein